MRYRASKALRAKAYQEAKRLEDIANTYSRSIGYIFDQGCYQGRWKAVVYAKSASRLSHAKFRKTPSKAKAVMHNM